MTRLFLVPKRVPAAAKQLSFAVGLPLAQLAALERAKDSIQATCRHLTKALEDATKLHAKVEAGTARFVAAWNAAHPTQILRRCRGAGIESACLRYTTNANGVCDTCSRKR